MCVCVKGGYNRSLCHPILGESKFVVLLKTVFTLNRKTNDELCAVDVVNKKILPKSTSKVLKMLFLLLKIYKNRLIIGSVFPY